MEKVESLGLAELGRTLADCRKQAKLTQREVGRQIFLSRTSISRNERGKRDSGIYDLHHFANACGFKLTLKVVSA